MKRFLTLTAALLLVFFSISSCSKSKEEASEDKGKLVFMQGFRRIMLQ